MTFQAVGVVGVGQMGSGIVEVFARSGCPVVAREINDELLELCKLLNETRDMETSSHLIPLVDDLTHILIETSKNTLN